MSIAATRRRSTVLAQVAAWAVAFVAVAVLLPVISFRSRDPDSALYAAIVAQSYQRPIVEWIAPYWGGHWERVDLFREHPAGLFVLPSLLARAGYPPWQAAYLVNALYQIATVLIVWRLAARMIPADEARSLSWLLLFLPITFAYRIRANHEQPILLAVLIGLYATEVARTRPQWSVATALVAAWAFLVKGVFALPLLAGCAVWLALRPALPGKRVAAWAGVGGAFAAAVVTAVGYEAIYRQISGDTFLGYYLPQQLGLAWTAEGPLLIRKPANLGWYAGRLLWFSFPWAIVLLVVLVHLVRDRTSVRQLLGLPVVRSVLMPPLSVALLWPLLFALSDRRADRYIFPAYILLGAVGVVLALRRYPKLRWIVERVERAWPCEQAVIWFALTALSLAALWLRLPQITL